MATSQHLLSNRISSPKPHFGCTRAYSNPYDADTNPNGIINMGVAENTLMTTELVQKVNTLGLELTDKHFKYGHLYGSVEFRKAVVDLLNEKLGVAKPLSINNIAMHNGSSSIIDSLALVISDENDGIMIPTPYYGGFNVDLSYRCNVVPVPIPTSSPTWRVTKSLLIETYLNALTSKLVRRIRAIIICNPNNPLGKIYPPEEVQVFLEFAKEFDLQVIVDEVYALTVWGETKFDSVLSYKNGVEWEKTHVVWGFSKDFCVNGFRVGCLISYNENVLGKVRELSLFSGISSVTDHLLSRLLITERPWVDWFLATKNERIEVAYRHVILFLDEMSIPYYPCVAGHFIWIDLRKYLPPQDLFDEYRRKYQSQAEPTTEKYLLHRILDAGVYIVDGKNFNCTEEGWFRWNYSFDINLLNLAMGRLKRIFMKMAEDSNEWKMTKSATLAERMTTARK